MTGRSTRKEKATRTFEWLKAVRGNTALLRIDAWTALDLAEWLSDDMTVFRSARMLARSIRCSPSTAAASLARLEAAGLLSRTEAKGPVSPSGGRRANTYTIAIPEEVFTDQPVETPVDQQEVFTDSPVKTEGGVFTDQPVRVFTDQPVTNTIEQSLEHDAEAPNGPPASISATGCDKGDVTGARKRARPSPDRDPLRGQPATCADLDRLAQLEREARDSHIQRAATELANLHPERLYDPRAFAMRLVQGFTEGDREEAEYAVEQAVGLFEDQPDRAQASALWRSHGAAVASLFAAAGSPHATERYSAELMRAIKLAHAENHAATIDQKESAHE